MQDESREDAERQGSDPQEQVVRDHQHFRISATAQHAFRHDAVRRLEEHDDRDRLHQLCRDGCRILRQVVGADDRATDPHDHRRGEKSQQESHAEEGIALLLGFFAGGLAECLADDDRAGLREALRQDGRELLDHSRDRVCRDEFAADTADDHRDRVVAEREYPVADQHRDADADVLLQQVSRADEKVLDPETDDLVLKEQISADHGEFEQAGDQCAHSRTGDTHLGHPQLAEDKGVIRANIDEESRDRRDQRDLGFADGPQYDRCRQGQAKQEIRHHRPFQVLHAFLDDRLLRCVDPHDRLRRDQRKEREKRRDGDGKAQHDGYAFLHVQLVLHAEVTGNQDGRAHRQAHTQDMIDIDESIGERNRGKRRLSDLADHDGVHHVNADGDQTLRGDRHRHHRNGFVEAFVLRDQFV